MYDSTTVTIGLDVHARSIRLAAVRADQLLEERTLPYDEEAVERVLRRWPGVRCCYEAGPTGFGLYRYLVDRGSDCREDGAHEGFVEIGIRMAVERAAPRPRKVRRGPGGVPASRPHAGGG